MAPKSRNQKTSTRRGPRGLRGAPGITPAVLQTMIGTMQRMQDEASTQFKRIAQMQVQIDQTLKALNEMGEKAGHQRTKRKK